ncbi:NEQ248 [Nanoarchaeum equitans Kin4-M]|uniref:NEQ248 n=1 Tax=Nanoarchaeum equitans (strain Kin4-M) TaxID=228908 RepID=Q74NF6_NANEQ|nr:NEQ248 [Nanoarchaeum equitans Kin4-M]
MRFDGRDYNEIRDTEMKIGVISKADGSAYCRTGNTIAIAAVYLKPGREQSNLKVSYRMLPFAGEERKGLGLTRREIELSYIIAKALEPAIIFEEIPYLTIEASVEIIKADAGTRVAAINALSLALAHAGIPMKALVGAIAVGKVGEKIVLDLNKQEEDYDSEIIKKELPQYYEYYGEGKAVDIPMAMYKNKITLLQLDGSIDRKSLLEAIKLGKDGIKRMIDLQKIAIEDYYF